MTEPPAGSDPTAHALTAAQEEQLERWLSGRLDPAEREAFEREALRSDTLFTAAYGHVLVKDVLGAAAKDLPLSPAPGIDGVDGEWRTEASRSSRQKGMGWLGSIRAVFGGPIRLLAPLTAAVVVVIWLAVRPTTEEPVWRGDRNPRALVPIGTIEALPESFSWTRAEGAARYRVRVFGSGGQPLAETVVPDTFVTVDRLSLPPALAEGLWTVAAETASGVELGKSPGATFTVSD